MSEDVQREPDGVPHSVVGLTAFFSVLLAMLVGIMFVSGGSFVKGAAVVLVIAAIPILVGALRGKAERDRDHEHPSR